MLSGEPIVNLPKHTTIGWTQSPVYGMWTKKFTTFGSPLAEMFNGHASLVSLNWWVVCPKEYS